MNNSALSRFFPHTYLDDSIYKASIFLIKIYIMEGREESTISSWFTSQWTVLSLLTIKMHIWRLYPFLFSDLEFASEQISHWPLITSSRRFSISSRVCRRGFFLNFSSQWLAKVIQGMFRQNGPQKKYIWKILLLVKLNL